jgi:hypothetical protein
MWGALLVFKKLGFFSFFIGNQAILSVTRNS